MGRGLAARRERREPVAYVVGFLHSRAQAQAASPGDQETDPAGGGAGGGRRPLDH